MEFVQPICEEDIIDKMKLRLAKGGLKYQMLFIFSINENIIDRTI